MSHHRHFKKSKKYFKRLAKRYAPELRDVLLLWFVGKKPAHGYELIKRFDSLDQKALKAKANRVYPGLERLLRQGFIEAEVDTSSSRKKPRKVYTLTPAGRSHLLKEIDELRADLESLKNYLDKIDGDMR